MVFIFFVSIKSTKHFCYERLSLSGYVYVVSQYNGQIKDVKPQGFSDDKAMNSQVFLMYIITCFINVEFKPEGFSDDKAMNSQVCLMYIITCFINVELR